MSEVFDSAKDYCLSDDCVLLRPLVSNDLQYLQVFARNEPEIWKYSTIGVFNEADLEKYIQLALDGRAQGREYPFIVFDKRSGRYAGSTRFYDIQLFHQTLQLGYTWYGKDFQGTGLNKHCKFLLLQFAFESLGMLRVEFRADLTNHRSIAAMKRIGCIEEGVLRKSLQKPDGSRRDSIILSILADEWKETVKENLRLQLS
jgi:N-acetyltransferase